MSRRYKHIILMMSFLMWLKTNRPTDYNTLENGVGKVPLNIVLDLMDALLYYKSKKRAMKIVFDYFKNREDDTLRRRLNDLLLWSKIYEIN